MSCLSFAFSVATACRREHAVHAFKKVLHGCKRYELPGYLFETLQRFTLHLSALRVAVAFLRVFVWLIFSLPRRVESST